MQRFLRVALICIPAWLLQAAAPDAELLIEKGNQFRAKGLVAEAEKAYRSAIAEATSPPDPPALGKAFNNLAALLYERGRNAEALPSLPASAFTGREGIRERRATL